MPQLEELAKKGGEEGRQEDQPVHALAHDRLGDRPSLFMSHRMQRSGVFYDTSRVVFGLRDHRVRRGHALPDVARRADHRQGHRQRRFADHLHRHRAALPEPGRARRSNSASKGRRSTCSALLLFVAIALITIVAIIFMYRVSAASRCSKRAASSGARCSRAARLVHSAAAQQRRRHLDHLRDLDPALAAAGALVVRHSTVAPAYFNLGPIAIPANLVAVALWFQTYFSPSTFLYNIGLLCARRDVHVLLQLDRRQTRRHRRQPQEERLVHPGHSPGPADRRVHPARSCSGSRRSRRCSSACSRCCPRALQRGLGVTTLYLGSTSLLIVVGVALDTMTQIEARLAMRDYKGFMKR